MDYMGGLRLFNFEKLESTEIFQTFQNKLKEDKWYKPVLDYSEKSTKVNRVYAVSGCTILLAATLLYQFGVQLICGAVGFLYPGYQTIELLEKFETNQGKRWLSYWLVFSAFNFLEIFLFFLHWLPGYSIAKCIFFVWCYIPLHTNGSDVIYGLLIRPLFKRNQEVVDDAINHLKVAVQNIYSESDIDNNTIDNTMGMGDRSHVD